MFKSVSFYAGAATMMLIALAMALFIRIDRLHQDYDTLAKRTADLEARLRLCELPAEVPAAPPLVNGLINLRK